MGCGTANVKKEFSSQSLLETGLVIGSITQTRSKMGHQGFSASINGLSVYFYNLKSGKRSIIKSDPWMLGSMTSGDFKDIDGRGKLFVIELDPGDYAFQGWHATQGSYTSVTPKNPSRFIFNVKAGEVIYVGELNFSLIFGTNLFGIGVLAGAEQFINDSESRDMDVVTEKYPKIDTGKIVKRLLVETNNLSSDEIKKGTYTPPIPLEQ